MHDIWWNLLLLPRKPYSLPMEPFCKEDEFTWDKFYDNVKRNYPVRYWLAHTVTNWFGYLWSHKICHFIYFLKSHLIPSRRYHIINIKQPKNSPYRYHYNWGFIDCSESIILVNFKILCDFVEKEFLPQYWWKWDEKKQKSCKLKKSQRKTWQQILEEYFKEDPKPEDFKFSDGSLNEDEYSITINDRKYVRELLTIYKWWKVDRFELCKKEDDALRIWHDFKMQLLKSKEAEKKEHELFNETMRTEEELLNQEEDMLIRLIKIRGGLWT